MLVYRINLLEQSISVPATRTKKVKELLLVNVSKPIKTQRLTPKRTVIRNSSFLTKKKKKKKKKKKRI